MISSNLISTGITDFDKSLNMLRFKDIVFFEVDEALDYKKISTYFLDNAKKENRNIVYFRFSNQDPFKENEKENLCLFDDLSGVRVFEINPNIGFNYFTTKIHKIISLQEENTFFVFDILTVLQQMWHSDLMISNFVKVTTPILKEKNSIACFSIKKNNHSFDTFVSFKEESSVLLDVHTINDELYVQHIKVKDRFSSNIFLPHKVANGKAIPITNSDEIARLFSNIDWSGKRLGYWRRTLNAARNAIYADEKIKEETKKILVYILIGNKSKTYDMCLKYFSLEDLVYIMSRVIGTGNIGGKSVGMLLATQIIKTEDETKDYFNPILETHDSFFIGADVYYSYIVENGLWDLRVKQRTEEGFFKYAPELKKGLENGKFSKFMKDQFTLMLEYFGQAPIVVRSSSLLEDNFGNAFAGKYESVFCINQGTPEERLEALENAVRIVYGSTMSQDAVAYRKNRGLDKRDEQMAILIQRVSGDYHGDYFYPHLAGVGNSSNLYVYDENVDMDAGMIRLVFGLGTRAVDRIIGDYVRIVTLDDPLRLPIMNSKDEQKYSQHSVDVLNLKTNEISNLNINDLINVDLKTNQNLFGSKDYQTQIRLKEIGLDPNRAPFVLNFKNLLRYTEFPEALKKVLATVSRVYDYPVDIEFTTNFRPDGSFKINIVQCRPLQTRGLGKTIEIPKLVHEKDCLFYSHGNFMGGNIRIKLDYVVFVSVDEYLALSEADKYKIARQIGILNTALKDESVLLMGPGRWGTTTPSLGVPVHFTELSNMAVMCEIAYSDKEVVPELSYGSHFFQDLVETGIFYVALFDNKHNVIFNEEILREKENIASTFSDAINTDVIKVYKTDGLQIYSDIKEQVVMCQ